MIYHRQKLFNSRFAQLYTFMRNGRIVAQQTRTFQTSCDTWRMLMKIDVHTSRTAIDSSTAFPFLSNKMSRWW